MKFNITAFGYKYGLPQDADLVFDVRFLPNPFYVNELKPYSGRSRCVQDFVLKSRETKVFLKRLFSFINQMVPFYLSDGKERMNVAVGCTGGKHRSVVVSYELKRYLTKRNYKASVVCRDSGRE